MRVLAVDPGARRLGLAVGDTETCVATPAAVVEVASLAASVDQILTAVRARGAELVVIGLPTDADGVETPACQRSHRLAERLREAGVETVLQPEWLTSDEARRRARVARRPPRAATDDLAAQVILEEYLSRTRRPGRMP